MNIEKTYDTVYNKLLGMYLNLKKPKLKIGKAVKIFGSYSQIKNTITISKTLCITDDVLENTICHEFAHAIAGIENGHNEIWRSTAKCVEEITGCSEINRTDKMPDGVHIQYKYVVVCTHCGAKKYYTRKSASINNIENYRCGKCYDKLKVEKLY